MAKSILFALLATFALAGTATAQQWSDAQQQVLDRLVACTEANLNSQVEASIACIHRDYMGWWGENPVPMPLSERLHRYNLENSKVKLGELQPLHIMIYGDVAIIHYVLMIITGQVDGPDQTNWVRWTDIMLRENNQWYWIADHGGPIEQDDQEDSIE